VSASTLPRHELRPAALADAEAVAALIAACNAADYDEPLLPAREVHKLWQTPGFRLAHDAWVAVDQGGHLFAYAHLLRHQPASFDPAVYVAPDRRTGEMEALLLARLEAGAREAAPAGGVQLVARVSERNVSGWRVLESAGYRRSLTFMTMEMRLDTPPAEPRWPEGLAVANFDPSRDARATYQADEEASVDKGYHRPMTFEQWAARMDLNGERCDPALWFLARDGAAVAGVALNFQVGGTGIGWVDHLGVRRPWRGRGVGRALLLHTLGAFFRRGIRRARLNVDAESLTNAPRLYESVGMRTVQEYHIYVKALATG
jgi:ribosomal protein S18 acetylase RimI-like enzyme